MNVDRRKQIKVIAALMCVVLLTGLIVNQTGILRKTTADGSGLWLGSMPNVAQDYKFGRLNGVQGTGKTKDKPYYISSADDLAQLSVNVNAGNTYEGYFFLLVTDINLNANEWTPIGSSNNKPFKGNFDGNEHTVTGLKLEGTYDNTGLFGRLNGAVISGLNIEGRVNVASSNVGSIAGYCADNTHVEDCTFSGEVNGGSSVGGIVGSMDGNSKNTIVNGCTVKRGSTVTATTERVGGVVGNLRAGNLVINCANYSNVVLKELKDSTGAETNSASGLVGYTDNGAIVNCYNSGTIQSRNIANGITAGNAATIRNCYNIGTVSSDVNNSAGAISAALSSLSSLDGVYYQSGAGIVGYVGNYSGNCKDVGYFTSYNAELKKDAMVADTQWTVQGKTLKRALDAEVTEAFGTYNNIREWGAGTDANAMFPVLTQIEGHQHDMSGKVEHLKPATCEEGGVDLYYCTKCSNYTEVAIGKLGHNVELSIPKPATCTVSGESVEICTRCQQVFEDTRKVIPPDGHQMLNEKVENSCTEDGYAVSYCSVCAWYDESTRVILNAPGHQYKDVDMPDKTVPATCTDDGMRIWYCTVCEEPKVVSAEAALGHDWGSEEEENSTCIHQGGKIKRCQRVNMIEGADVPCTEKIYVRDADGNEIRYPMSEHDWKETKDNEKVYCEDTGYKIYECNVCKNQKTETYDYPTEHDWVEVEIVPPTCVEKGYTRYECNNCPKEKREKETEKAEHIWEITSETKATCLQGGRTDYKCKNCSETKFTRLPSLGGHNYVASPEHNIAATCTTPGYEMEVCMNEGCTAEPHILKEIPALGHDHQSEVIAAQCLKGGYTLWTCSRGCGDTYTTNPTSALGHDLNTDNPTIIPPTTTTMGKSVIRCSRCDDATREFDFIAATPDAHFDTLASELTLSDMEEVMKYSVDGGETWIVTEASVVAVSEEELHSAIVSQPAVRIMEATAAGSTAVIKVVRPGTEESDRPIKDSYVQDVEVKINPDPSQVTVITLNNPTDKNGLGSITGVNSSMEYRAENDKLWTPVTGESIENLQPGRYYVRLKATDSAAADAVGELYVILEYSDSTPTPPTPTSSGVPPTTTPFESSNPYNSEKPGQNTNPPQNSEGPGVSLKPGTSGKPQPTGKPGQTTPPRQSTAPKPSAVPTDGNNGNNGNSGSNNGGLNNSGQNNNGNQINNGNQSNNTDNGQNNSSQNSDGSSNEPVKNNVYYSSNGGSGGFTGGSSKVTTAKTGDNSNIAAWLAVAGIATTAFAIVISKKRREAEM